MDVEHMCVASQMQAGIRIAGTAEFAGIEADADNRRAFIFKKALKISFQQLIWTRQNHGWAADQHFQIACHASDR